MRLVDCITLTVVDRQLQFRLHSLLYCGIVDWDIHLSRYDPFTNLYHYDMEGNGVICLAVDILPTEFAKEASQHFGDILSQFIGSLACTKDISELPSHLRRACIAHGGSLTHLYEYIPRMRNSDSDDMEISPASGHLKKKKYTTLVSLSGHLFDQFLINEALDIIEAAGGSFHLVRCEVGQSANAMSYSELEVGADDSSVLDQIIDSLTSIANPSEKSGVSDKEKNKFSLRIGKVHDCGPEKGDDSKNGPAVLILGAGRVCRPAAELLASTGSSLSWQCFETCVGTYIEETEDVQVIVASLYLKDAEEVCLWNK
ncbi:PREDICTED: alpha-aminoadipic semialdehyde synthase-like [Nelumbo nucifera]|uniref:Alpha-aminoadipic semialdehyde synthase-like n=1 Tax=Nelumbo nucifera TaxID=4432 RepID=A0A1U7ZA52_NELNU|nr:PREDICTED: alpha-aminoadipic semialdehyde synthase-like [Nelumbo nucifera]